MTDNSYIPSRFRQANVERFKLVLVEVTRGTPVIRFKHAPLRLNANTAMCRIRDAALAVIRGIVHLDDVDADQLRNNWVQYHVRYDPISREVVVTTQNEVSSPQLINITENIVEFTLRVEEPDFPERFKGVAHLLSSYDLKGRVTILGMLPDELKTHVQSLNIVLTQVAPNEHILS